MSTFKARQKIRSLNRINLETCSYRTLSAKISGLLADVVVEVVENPSWKPYFRCRKMTSKPMNATELAAPPAQYVTGYQRCNPPNTPYFYCSDNRLISLKEVRPADGDKIYLSEWIGNTGLLINDVFSTSETATFQSRTPLSDLVHTYMETLFTRPIHQDFSNQYKLTSAFSQILTNGFLYPNKDNGHAGLKYPSVLNLEVGSNFAFPDAMAKQELHLLHVCEVSVEIDGSAFSFTPTDNAFANVDGTLVWLETGSKFPAARTGKKTEFVWESGEWRIVTNTSENFREAFETILSERFDHPS